MKYSKRLSWILALNFLFVFALSAITFSYDQNNAERVRFEQQMAIALELWETQHPDAMSNVTAGEDASSFTLDYAGTGSIEGLVTSSDGTPLKAYVLYWGMNKNEIASGSVTTDESGNYKIDGLAEGKYYVVAAANGHLPQFYQNANAFNAADPVPVKDTETTSDIDFSLSPANKGNGSISGTVKSEGDDQPISEAWVMGFNIQNPLNAYFASTDETGAYQLIGLTPGAYVLYAQASGYVSEFHTGGQSPVEAMLNPFPVQNNAVTDKGFTLKEGGSIAGTIVDSEGTAIEGVKVTAFPFNHQDFFGIPFVSLKWQYATTDENGKYTISGLAEGQYRVLAAIIPDEGMPRTLFYDNTDSYKDATPVKVTSGVVTEGKDFTFEFTEPTGAIAGTVVEVEGTPLSGIWVTAWESRGSVFHGHFGLWNYVKTDENGQYQIDNLWPSEEGGGYIVSATRWEWWDYQTIYYNGAEELEDAELVPVMDGEVTTGIDFEFEKGRELGSISGTVLSETDNSPVSYAILEAIPVNSLIDFPHIRPVPAMVGFSDENGEYHLENLVEGDYIVAVTKNGYVEYYDDAQNRGEATPVTVTGGEETSGKDFLIPPFPETGSKISGTVTDDDTGEAIAGAVVGIFSKLSNHKIWGKVDHFITASESDGSYLIGGLPAGDYIAACWARGYIAEFYDDQWNPISAQVIQLDGSEEKTGIDFALTPGESFDYLLPEGNAALGTISGTVTSTSGDNINGAYIYAFDADNNVVASEMTGSDGQYALGGLSNGSYKMMATRVPYESEYFDNANNLDSATPLIVGDEGTWDVKDVDFELAPVEATSVEQRIDTPVPDHFALSQNHPNPFNPTTTIHYSLPEAVHVTLQIINMRGEVVRTLVNKVQSAQVHSVAWNGKDSRGQTLPSGLYLYRLQAGEFSQTRQMMLLK